MKYMNRKKKTLIIVCFILLLGIVASVYFILKQDFRIKSFKNKIVINYNDGFHYEPGNVCYGNLLKCKKLKNSHTGTVDTSTLDTYDIKYIYKYKNKTKTLKQVVIVKDIKVPVINVEYKNDGNKVVDVCPNGNTDELIIKANDNYDGDLTDKITKKVLDDVLILNVIDSNGNKASHEIDVNVIKDTKKPKIKINGSTTKNVIVGSTYKDEGAKAYDNCDEKLEIKTKNNVDTSKVGTYYVTYTSTDKAGNTETVKRKVYVNNKIQDGSKIIYLTFDDGPSAYTNGLLDILKKYDVKVTFFVTGNGSDSVIKREHDEGHTVALHTKSHDYSYVYSSVDNYFKDLYAIQNRVKKITGETSTLIRFPGGSSNTVSMNYDKGTKIMSTLTKEVEKRGFHYFDWNASSGDGGATTSTKRVYSNVIKGLNSDYSIVLQHDTQKFSIDAVEKIIKYCLDHGYTFKPLDETSPGSHHGVNN